MTGSADDGHDAEGTHGGGDRGAHRGLAGQVVELIGSATIARPVAVAAASASSRVSWVPSCTLISAVRLMVSVAGIAMASLLVDI
jgi:hypothetical protein